MPVILNVTGPHQILYGTSGSPATSAFGRADNDDLFSIDIEYKYQDIYTNEFGQNPANAILMGATAFVSFTLVTYDPSALASVFQSLDAQSGSGFLFPKVGALAIPSAGAANLISLKVSPDIANSPTYDVDRCRLITHTLKDTGNKPTRAAFKFEILPGTAGSSIYTKS